MPWATVNGKVTPLISKAVMLFIPSIQASNGDRHTYQPAQKNPIGQARNNRTRNQMIPQRSCFPLILILRLLLCCKEFCQYVRSCDEHCEVEGNIFYCCDITSHLHVIYPQRSLDEPKEYFGVGCYSSILLLSMLFDCKFYFNL